MPDSSFTASNQIATSEIGGGQPLTETLMTKYRARDIELIDLMTLFGAPLSVGAGSSVSQDGDVTISSNQNLSGLHYYDNLTINSGVTVTVPQGEPLIIVCTATFDMSGATIDADGGGAAGGTAGVLATPNGGVGVDGWSAAGGGGGGASTGSGEGGDGGDCHPGGTEIRASGGGGGVAATGGTGTSTTTILKAVVLGRGIVAALGGAGGGGGGYDDATNGGTAGAGGDGGGTVIIIAPTVICSGGTITADGSDGAAATGGSGEDNGGGGGGGGGLVKIDTKSYTAGTITVTGGSGGAGSSSGYSGGAGVAGLAQINIYG